MKTLYLMVTADKYSLPLAVADSAIELAEMVGLKRYSILTMLARYKGKHPRYIMVEIDDPEWEEEIEEIEKEGFEDG